MSYEIFAIALGVVFTWILIRVLLDAWTGTKFLFKGTGRWISWGVDRLRARHEQRRREVWHDVGFQNAMDCVCATSWKNRAELLENMQNLLDSRRG